MVSESADMTLNWLTAGLVAVTFLLAVGIFLLAWRQGQAVKLQAHELRTLKEALQLTREQLQLNREQLDLNVQQIAVTRDQLRPHLDLSGPTWPQPGSLPTARVECVSGSGAASDVCTWFKTNDGRRFGKMPSTPSPSHPQHDVTIDELPTHLEQIWTAYFTGTEADATLTNDEWWAGVTWRAADKRRYAGCTYSELTWWRPRRSTCPTDRTATSKAAREGQPALYSWPVRSHGELSRPCRPAGGAPRGMCGCSGLTAFRPHREGSRPPRPVASLLSGCVGTGTCTTIA